MKKIHLFAVLAVSVYCLAACSSAEKARRAEEKQKKKEAQLQQLESDKRQFEQKNQGDLGK